MSSPMESPDGVEISRRMFVFSTTAAFVGSAILAGCGGDTEVRQSQVDIFCDGANLSEHKVDATEFPDLFANEVAQKAADNLNINPGSYFRLNGDAIQAVNDSSHFLSTEWLAPIFPPAVTRFKDEIIAAANEFKIPPNVLASLATIESAGNTSASSGANAHGIVQIVPKYHGPRIDKIAGKHFANDKERSAYLIDRPDECLRVGASYYAECVAAARHQKPNLRHDSMVIFARAAAAYNGGPTRAGQSFDGLPLESKLYVNHVARLTLDVAIAGELNKQGKSDKEILRSMQSVEMNARAAAYDVYPRGGKDFKRYERSATLCSTPEPGIDPETGDLMSDPEASQINETYRNFLRTCREDNPYKAPAVPSLRIWLVGGGDSLFLSVPQNAAWRLPS